MRQSWIGLGLLALAAGAAAAPPVAPDRPGTPGTSRGTLERTPAPKQPTSDSRELPTIRIDDTSGDVGTPHFNTTFFYVARGGLLGSARVELRFRGRGGAFLIDAQEVSLERSGRIRFSRRDAIAPEALKRCGSTSDCHLSLRFLRDRHEQRVEMPLVPIIVPVPRPVRSLGSAGPLDDYAMSVRWSRPLDDFNSLPSVRIGLSPGAGAAALPRARFEYWYRNGQGDLQLLRAVEISEVSRANVGLVPQTPRRLFRARGHLDVRVRSGPTTLSVRMDLVAADVFKVGRPTRVTDKR